jgi:hypothetical protein
MRDDEMKAALDAACRRMCCGETCRREEAEATPSVLAPRCCADSYRGRMAASIAGFLRGLGGTAGIRDAYGADAAIYRGLLIEAVERAAKEAQRDA